MTAVKGSRAEPSAEGIFEQGGGCFWTRVSGRYGALTLDLLGYRTGSMNKTLE